MEQGDLTAKLALYESNLAHVEQRLVSDPSNAELTHLRNNLREYIELTKDLLGIKDKPSVTASQKPATPAGANRNAGALKKVEVGQYVQANCSYAGMYTNAVVTEITAGGTSCKVSFMGYNITDTVPLSSLRPPVFLKPSDIKVGMTCEGVWSEDNYWYAAVIDGMAEDGKKYNVTYTQYGNKEALDIRHIRLPLQASASPATAAKADKKRPAPAGEDADELEDFVVPEKLKILPSDSEEVRSQKKKKLHALKSAHRLKQSEAEKDKKAKSWSTFTHKAGAKPVKGFLSSGKKESIFKTTEEGKVGVTGSGKGTTQWKNIDPHSVKKAVGAEDDDD